MATTSSGPRAGSPPSRWNPGRVVALVLGILLLLPGLGLLAGGGVLLWADRTQRTDDGYPIGSEDSFSTSGYALLSDRLDLSTGADWVPLSAALGDARVQVTSTDPGTGVFVGIARVGDSSPYLDGVDRTIVRDVGSGNTAADEVDIAGNAPDAAPGTQDIWAAQASGPGTQQLTWKPADGQWTLVVMNADGSADVSVDAAIGATVPAVTGLAWGLMGAGLVCVLVGVLLLALAVRRRPSGDRWPPYRQGAAGPVPAGPPPSGTPPSGTPPSGTPPSGTPPSGTPPAPTDRTSAADAQPDASTTGVPPQGPTTG
jgi:hypothetical protein